MERYVLSALVIGRSTEFVAQFIHNIRRSPQMSEPFEFDVVSRHTLISSCVRKLTVILPLQAFTTSFEQIERLRDLMLAFLKAERRDYQPIFDVYVMGRPYRA